LRRRDLKRKIAGNIAARAAFMRRVSRRSAMFAEIQKLEAAARIAMGHFESQVNASSATPRERFPNLAYALLALTAFGLVVLALL
jgi:hypothetical protein